GYLRLHTATVTNNLYEARNTLTQRIIGYHDDLAHNYGTVALDISHMQDGDHAGLAIFQDPLAGIGVKIDGSKKVIYHYSATLAGDAGVVETDIAEISGDVVYLRAVVSMDDPASAEFYYSTDNSTYNKVGTAFRLPYELSVFIGNRFAIFNYAAKSLGGYVDVDWFSTDPVFSEEMFYPAEFESFSKESLTAVSLEADADELVVMTGSNVNLNVIARFEDGHTENVAGRVSYTVSDPSVVSVRSGAVKGLRDGRVTITVDYCDPLGNVLTLDLDVESTTFPLVSGLFNPSIWESGTFDESTCTVITGQYGFAGWNYSNGVDLSDYRYLVAKVAKSPQAGGLSFRIFDENNYWAGCHSATKSSASDCDYFLVDLGKAWKDDKSRKIDPSHIYYVGFWTYGGSPFVIKDVYVTNDSNYLDHSGIVDIDAADMPVDVYTLQGILLMHGVSRTEAISTLKSGIYIIGGHKVMVSKF
ncbi:MAG: xylan 1,4-beta-xylosidase, partial [Muribaculaceae bacterium]|nr:xylan 1,4-beta-xylosidase [Muribaculaceae bacterium]